MDDVRTDAEGVNESWKPVAAEPFGTQYEVSDLGHVRRIGSIQNLRPAPQSRGYMCVGLYFPGAKPKKQKTFTVHRLVALTFLDPSEKPQINHKDGVKSNNAASNLEWCTQKENNHHARVTGLATPYGRRNYSKLSEQEAREALRLSAVGVADKRVGEALGVSETAIRQLRIGLTWASLPRSPELVNAKRGAKSAADIRRAKAALRRFVNARTTPRPAVGIGARKHRTSAILPESVV